ncbi:MAG: 4Fe-4S binding protein [Spirochaetia bacterium]|nr:4Fe-4S binding protein [Spirochaetia bacterium]
MIIYLKNIWETYATVFEGMAITFSYLLQRPITVQYPDRMKESVPETLPEKYRGRLMVDTELCTACGLCAKACPIDVIEMKGGRAEGKKGLRLIYFNIYHGKCMYCNLCVEACPAEDGEEDEHHTAIYFKKNFEGSSYTLNGLVEQFIPPDEARRRLKESEEIAAKRAAAAAETTKNSEAKQESDKPKDGGDV